MQPSMLFKITFLLPLLFLTGILSAQSISEERVVKLEAKYYCQCYKSFQKEKKKATKAKKKRGIKLFGGSKIDFSYGECLKEKRKKKVNVYLEGLDKKAQKKLGKKVKKAIRQKCPEAPARHY